MTREDTKMVQAEPEVAGGGRYCHFIINNDEMVEAPQSTELVDTFRKGSL